MKVCFRIFSHSVRCSHCMEKLYPACCRYQLDQGRLLCCNNLHQGYQVSPLYSLKNATPYKKVQPRSTSTMKLPLQWSTKTSQLRMSDISKSNISPSKSGNLRKSLLCNISLGSSMLAMIWPKLSVGFCILEMHAMIWATTKLVPRKTQCCLFGPLC